MSTRLLDTASYPHKSTKDCQSRIRHSGEDTRSTPSALARPSGGIRAGRRQSAHAAAKSSCRPYTQQHEGQKEKRPKKEKKKGRETKPGTTNVVKSVPFPLTHPHTPRGNWLGRSCKSSKHIPDTPARRVSANPLPGCQARLVPRHVTPIHEAPHSVRPPSRTLAWTWTRDL